MKELLENANEFIESGEENLIKKRYNAATADFFRASSNICDYIIYQDTKIIPKNHNERFQLLKKYFTEIYEKIYELFKTYRESYNLKMKKQDAEKIKKYCYELKNTIRNKK